MKITETTERECCQAQDLRPYKGTRQPESRANWPIKFCIHCGQVWTQRRVEGPIPTNEFEWGRVAI